MNQGVRARRPCRVTNFLPCSATTSLPAGARHPLGLFKSEDCTPEEKWGLIEDADAHLGLSLINPPTFGPVKEADIPEEIREMLASREVARTSKDFKRPTALEVKLRAVDIMWTTDPQEQC